MRKRVLVFPCGSEIGLEINRSLAYSTHFILYGGSSVDDHGRFVYKNYIPNLPMVDDHNFIDAINQVIEQYNIDFVIPAHDSVVLKMAENEKIINANVVGSPAETCMICRSKKKTYDKLTKIILTPKQYCINDELNFPVFLKPEVGQSSKGTYKAETKEEVVFYTKKDSTLLILEYLPGKEYTVDCFTNKRGKLLFAKARERMRINNGISVHSEPVNNNKKFKEIAEKINKILAFRGVWFFQLKERKNGELVLLEIAPRIAGTMALYRSIGVNFIQLSLFDKMEYNVGVIENQLNIEIDKAFCSKYHMQNNFDTVYIDFDDTIIQKNGIVNTEIIRLLYQLRNEKKKIILITKHRGDIKKTMDRYAISVRLFDDIILLKETQSKSDFINAKKAIFIDDSFAERKIINDKHKIPVFGIDAIEALLTWRV